MGLDEMKGILIFIGLVLLGGLLLFGFLLFALIIAGLLLLAFLGLYAYIRIKLWWMKRHPPKELESPYDYL